MDQATLVNEQIEGGSRLIEQLGRDGFPISAAFWLFTSEADQWFLYLASPLVDEKGIREGYNIVHPAIRRMPGLGVDPLEVELIGVNDPLAEAVSSLLDRHPAPMATRVRGRYLGDVFIEQAYIYPPIRPRAVSAS